MTQLRPHQVKALELVRSEMKAGHRWVCAVMATGAGKTVFGATAALQHIQKAPTLHRVLWLCHREELVSQAYDTLERLGLVCGVVQSSPSRTVNPFRPVQVASVQTLVAREHRLEDITFVIYDECFVAGTLIDGVPIERIDVGDFVSCVDHHSGKLISRRVERLFRSRPSSLVRVNGTVCTPSHPFFVPGEGYIRADGLQGKWIVRRVQPSCTEAPENVRGRVSSQAVIDDDDGHEQAAWSTRVPSFADAGGSKSNEFGGSAGKNGFDASRDGTLPSGARWEREAASPASGGTRQSGRGPNGVCGRNRQGCESAWACKQLQDRRCGAGVSAGDRDRWCIAWNAGKAGTRCEKGELFALERVDSVEVLQPGPDGTYGGICPDGQVYNLEVAEHHNYFADGVLVHNCHHSASDGWSKNALWYKERGIYGIGLTATPVRSDGLPLGDIYDAIVCPISMAELIEQGYLVHYELVRPRSPLRKQQIAQRPVDAWKEHARGHKTLVFAANVAWATLFRDQFRSEGISAELITGETESSERRALLAAYRTGKIAVLCNVGVLTEGFDDPSTSCVILARGVGSVALYLQMLGRALRPSPETGKTGAILIDLYGSSWKHGAPDEDREFTLDGDGIRRKKLEQAPERFCRVCGVTLEADVAICVECGTESSGNKPPEIVGAALVKYARMRKLDDEQRAASLRKWIIDARAAGHKLGRAYHKYKHVFGDWPPPEVKLAAMATE